MNDREEERTVHTGVVLPPVSSLAWSMFAQTGMPGMYMLYRDLEREDERSPLD